MKDIQVNTEIVNINTLRPNPKNPRTATREAMDRLKVKLDKLGQFKDIIIDTRTGYIVGGHMRYEALKEMGVLNVKVSYVTSENDEEAWDYAFTDNDNVGVYDKEQVLSLAEEFPGIVNDQTHVQFDEGESIEHFMKQFDKPLMEVEEVQEEETDKKEEKEVTCPKCGHIWVN